MDLLSALSLIGGSLAVISAIWQVAGIKEKIVQRVDKVEGKLSESLTREIDKVEDLIRDLEKRFELANAKLEAERKTENLQRDIEEEQQLIKYQTIRKDVYDVQQFLQLKHGFKIRINTPTPHGVTGMSKGLFEGVSRG